LPNRLAVGPLPQAGNSLDLRHAQIDAIFSLCAESEGDLPEDVSQNFSCLRCILPDSSYIFGLKLERLAFAISQLHHLLQQYPRVYIHCLAGVERSPTVCIAYLCVSQNIDLWQAVNQVKRSHPDALPTEHQLKTIREFVQRFPSLDLLTSSQNSKTSE
jgi:hypothetical protein